MNNNIPKFHNPEPYPWNPSFCARCNYPVAWHNEEDYSRKAKELEGKEMKTFTNHQEHQAYYYPDLIGNMRAPCSTHIN